MKSSECIWKESVLIVEICCNPLTYHLFLLLLQIIFSSHETVPSLEISKFHLLYIVVVKDIVYLMLLMHFIVNLRELQEGNLLFLLLIASLDRERRFWNSSNKFLFRLLLGDSSLMRRLVFKWVKLLTSIVSIASLWLVSLRLIFNWVLIIDTILFLRETILTLQKCSDLEVNLWMFIIWGLITVEVNRFI